MAQYTLTDLVSQVRLESGIRNNPVISDQEIMTLVGEGYSDLRDRLIIRFAAWFRKEVTFSLAGGSSSYIFDLSTVPDFQMAQGLDLAVSDGVYATVDMLPSFAERNSMNGLFPYWANSSSWNGLIGRKYLIDGDQLQVLPPQNANGNYRLIYTPIENMQLPGFYTSASPAPGDDWTIVNGCLRFDISGLTVDANMLGGSLTVALAAPNDKLNGVYGIDPATPVGAHYIQTTQVAQSVPSPSGPLSGAFTVGANAPGSIYVLPVKLNPWVQYITLYAALSIRQVREQDVTALLQRYNDIKQRVIDLTKQRSEGVRQAPISRRRYGYGGYGSGGLGG